MRMMTMAGVGLALGLSGVVQAEETQPTASPAVVASADQAMPMAYPGAWGSNMHRPQPPWGAGQSWGG